MKFKMENKSEGLIPKAIKRWLWKRKFTKKELKEIDSIKKESFMKEMRKKAEADGVKMAKEEHA